MPKNNSFATLRVIAGNLKGQKLLSPHSDSTHPMGAREKNALFNMVDVAGKRVLDAYAGSGALGIEALSRGAAEVTFVENNRRAVAVIKQNLTNLGLIAPNFDQKCNFSEQIDLSAPKISIFAFKIADFAKKHAKFDEFDVIIADPPYDKIDLAEIAGLAALLIAGGTLALSSPASQPIPDIPGLATISSHTYAEARITVFTKA